MTRHTLFLAVPAALLLGACASSGPTVLADAKSSCAKLVGVTIPASEIGLPSGVASIDSAVLTAAEAIKIAPGGPTPAARITPATPEYCKVLGRIAPIDPAAPFIMFQVNLPSNWNGRAVQFGGGGFNGVLINALGLVPAARFDQPSPLAQGFMTYGTDSGHQNKQGEPPQTFALNNESLVNFAHASYKKVKDVAVAIARRAYDRAPQYVYFVGSSEGGREGLTVAQRYPKDYNGVFSRVPVIHWTGLQHAGLRDGLATVGEGWLPPAQVKRVHAAVLSSCDAADGLADGVVSDPVGCRARFDVASLRCTAANSEGCLNDAQIKAVKTLNADYTFDFELANGLRTYPGRGPSGEGLAANGPTGGWNAWWLGKSAPEFPPKLGNGIAWYYGGGAIQYFYAKNPKLDLRQYNAKDHKARIVEVSAMMDSTNPDLSAFHANGGKLLLLENLADYAQSPYAGIQYFQSVEAKLGASTVRQFARLYAAPGVDHVGTGAPSQFDALGTLTAWVERGQAPASPTLVEQDPVAPFTVKRSRPLCEWPLVPRYKSGDASAAGSFECLK